MHQTKKGNEWYFGMKMPIGIDESLGLIHSISTTPANAHGITQAHHLLHGKEKRVWADAGYTKIKKREEHEDRDVEWLIAMRPGKRSTLPTRSQLAAVEKPKVSVRAKVEDVVFYV